MLRIGFVGLGKMGLIHLMNCRHIENVRIVAAADLSKNALKKAKDLGATNLYTDYHDFFRNAAEIDAVIVSVPNFLHFQVAKLALEAGLDTFVEKPLANTTRECEELVKSVEKSGRKLMVGHVLRFFEDIENMKETVDKGYIGNIEVITLERIASGPFSHGVVPKPVPEWWFDPEKAGGGAMLDLGYHLIDLFRFFTGDCHLLYSYLGHKFDLQVEDTAIAVLKSDNSSTEGIIHTGWYENTVFPQNDSRVIIHGNAGYISTEHFEPSNIYFHAAKEGIKNVLRKVLGRKIKPLAYAYGYTAFHKELEHFFNCVERDLDPKISAVDGLEAVKIIEEVYHRERTNGE